MIGSQNFCECQYYSDEWQIVEERIANATPADKTHVWGLRYIDDLVWIDDGATRQYALHDYYSIIAVTNTSGVVQQRYGFSAYGERRVLNASYVQTSSSATSDVGYGGYYEDAGTKMYQVRNRFLHPGLGRWINRDPIGYGGGINLYGYVNGNPVNGVDYFGLCTDEERARIGALKRFRDKAALSQKEYDEARNTIVITVMLIKDTLIGFLCPWYGAVSYVKIYFISDALKKRIDDAYEEALVSRLLSTPKKARTSVF